MSELPAAVSRGLASSFRDFAGTVRGLAEGLSDEQFWRWPYPYGNSFGHLVLHLDGNLNHFVGARVTGTSYVRDREREFTEGARPPKEEVLARLDETDYGLGFGASAGGFDVSAGFGSAGASSPGSPSSMTRTVPRSFSKSE